jgi:hypothetical protein
VSPTSRRRFLRSSLRAALAVPAVRALGGPASAVAGPARRGLRALFPDPALHRRGASALGAALHAAGGGVAPLPPPGPESEPRTTAPPRSPLAERFPDLKRHFVFEYYPWYHGPPRYIHWDQWDRVPPLDLASNYVPHLGAYDSHARAVVEQHARWMAEANVGAISLSWWGPGSYEDRAVPLVMDVMRAHDIKVTFHLEPYREDRAHHYASDVLHLVREYGDRRGWDAFLLLRDADGVESPVLKGFAMLLPERVRDCHGVEHRVGLWAPDGVWRQQTESIRTALREDFARVTLLTDTTDTNRARVAGFDGIAIYDNFVGPELYDPLARRATQSQVVYSFNVNPGFDIIEPRTIEPDSCYAPLPFDPPTDTVDWRRAEERERAAARSLDRIRHSFAATVAVQTNRTLLNPRRGFFLAYVNSFNEWHEGHAFEPMRDGAALGAVEAAFGYHNPAHGSYRLEALRDLIASLTRRA